ncbi:hypothetical protein LSM04_007541 [Trypanosoma melophagium]|uniref:uncharacterized protein n=1 Tax=Trypanosoma melophagium TaxID=715481 RepID=UPI00351A66BB|nr:hypothetical protein LSM04_005854 [Trypanosoma melophagium]KAH9582175.1 hypothetical protein LSM04_006957 [Trypanosoma melophagium]KAH9582206.1 hypothetical protein LSM04_007541 [Trypanosoma melophagium]
MMKTWVPGRTRCDAAPPTPPRRYSAAAVAQANPLWATHAAAHHKKCLRRSTGCRHRAGPEPKSLARTPQSVEAASASRGETCATVKPAPHRGAGATGCRGRSPQGGSHGSSQRGPCQQHETPRPVVTTSGATQHTYSHERQTQKRAYYWRQRERASGAVPTCRGRGGA